MSISIPFFGVAKTELKQQWSQNSKFKGKVMKILPE
jgi:hypothetical protein